jgi:hypothetical protein
LPRGGEQTRLLLHMYQDQQETQLVFFWTHVLLSQDMRKLVNPSIDALKGFPIGLSRLESFFQKMLQA